MPSSTAVLGSSLVFALAAAVPAQQLVRELATAPTQPFSTMVRQLVGDGQRVFFTASTEDSGESLFVSDGTAAGTRLYKDLPAGVSSDLPAPLGMLGSQLVFGQSSLLWITDSTPQAATFLSDQPSFSMSGITRIGQVGARCLFAERGQLGNTELWATDGTAAGTVSLGTLYVNRSIVAGGQAFFAAAQGSLGHEPWISDGTPAGTRLIADLVPGGSSHPTGFATLNGVVHFLASLANGDLALWRTDGSAAGTVMIQAFAGMRLNGANAEMIEHNGRLLFVLGNDLCSSDGTPTGLQIVAANLPELAELRSVGGTCYFTARTAASGRELYATDGTIPGTRILVELSPGAADTSFAAFAEVQGRLFARYFASTGWGLLVSDGTAAGTSSFAAPGPQVVTPGEMVACGSGVLCNVANGLLRSDGTAAGTVQIAAIGSYRPGTTAKPGVALGDQLLFFASDRVSGLEPWRSDGSASGTLPIVDLLPGAGSGIRLDAEIAAMDGMAYFTSGSGATSWTAPSLLYRTDGTAAGTVALTSYAPGNGGQAKGLQVSDHALYFVDATPNRVGLFRTDGLSVQQVPHVAMRTFAPFLVVDGLVYYFADSYSLWRSDGTAGGTFELASQTNRLLGQLHGRAVFVDGAAIKITDGTVAGTSVLLSMGSGGSPWQVREVGSFAGALCWLQPQSSSASPYQLWRSDGTAAGTTVVATFPRQPRQTAIGADAIYLLVDDLQHGSELWRCDGTAAGTAMVTDLAPGRESGVLSMAAVAAGTRLFLAATDGVHGLEPWISDGTATGTVPLLDANSNGSSNPLYLGSAGSRCFFLLDDGVLGLEPWQAPLSVLGAASAQSLGRGCAGSVGVPELTALGAPRVDAPGFGLELQRAPAGGFVVFLLGTDRAPMALPSGCTLWPAGMQVPCFSVAGLQGQATLPLPIPRAPALVGAELTAQCGALDAFGTALPGVSTSNALLLVIGG